MTLQDAIAKIGATQAFSALTLTDVNQKNVVGDTPLHIAACWGNTEMIRILLDHGAAGDAPGNHGLTPLHIAAEEDKFDAVRLLIDRGARPVKSAQGDLPSGNCSKGSKMYRLLVAMGY